LPAASVELQQQVSGVSGEGLAEGDALTVDNLKAYAAAVQRQALVDNLQPHLSHVVEEFQSLVPEALLSEMTWQQLQERLSGRCLTPEAFMQLWKERTAYKLCTEEDTTVQLWWEYVAQCNSEELSNLFTWCTGFAAPPATPWKFQIQVIDGTQRLPSVNTCLTDETSRESRGVKMPVLYLPTYESKEDLVKFFKLATAGSAAMAMHLR